MLADVKRRTSVETLISNAVNVPEFNLSVTGDGSTDDLITLKNNNYARIASYAFSDDLEQNAPFIGFRARGTESAPSNVQANDRITGLYGFEYANGKYFGSAAIELLAGESAGTSGTSSYIKFGTTGVGSITRSERMRIAENGNVGIGTSTPKSKLQVTNGDIYIENATSGVIMTSPNGSCFRMTVDDSGNPVFTAITCPN